MRRFRLSTRFALIWCLAFAVTPADAHAQAATACAKIIWDFVGKPLTTAMLSKAGELIVEHFADRMQHGGTTDVSQGDIQVLQREFQQRGMTECDLRRQLEAMYGSQGVPPYASPYPSPYPQPTYYPAPPRIASACITQWMACPMAVQLPVGSSCACYTQAGVVPGIAQ